MKSNSLIKRLVIAQVICLLFSIQLLGQNILFVGNSLTYSNDLPQIFEQLAKTVKLDITTICVCYPNYSLEDHWFKGDFKNKLANESFDFIIMQQGPSSQALGREWLIKFGKMIQEEASKYDTRTAYYMVWPSKQYYYTFEAVIKNHRDAAQMNNSMLIPVGRLWHEIDTDSQPAIELYGYDEFHPSMQGSFLAALVMLQSLHPELNLSKIPYSKCTKWVGDETSFNYLIDKVNASN